MSPSYAMILEEVIPKVSTKPKRPIGKNEPQLQKGLTVRYLLKQALFVFPFTRSVTDAGTSSLCETICSGVTGVILVIESFVSQCIEVFLSEWNSIDRKVICDSDWVELCSISGIESGLIASSLSGWLLVFSWFTSVYDEIFFMGVLSEFISGRM
ncbi:704_t:CDS:2, partial [Racocetra persica]